MLGHGGWGVDALLGRVTREHKDLDLLVLLEDLPRYVEVVRQHGFERDVVWDESLPIDVNGLGFDSAFVDAHPDGRDIDVHVIDLGPQGEVIPIHADPWPLPPDPISGVGTIGGSDRALRHPSSTDRHAFRLRLAGEAPRGHPPPGAGELKNHPLIG